LELCDHQRAQRVSGRALRVKLDAIKHIRKGFNTMNVEARVVPTAFAVRATDGVEHAVITQCADSRRLARPKESGERA
jgi:hypothetical protein